MHGCCATVDLHSTNIDQQSKGQDVQIEDPGSAFASALLTGNMSSIALHLVRTALALEVSGYA